MATETSLKVRLLNASKTHAEWTAADPVLKKGEIAYSSDKKQIRVGDGSSKWSRLSYIDAGHIVGLSNSGSTITYTKADGSTGTITLPEYKVATSSTPGLVKSGGDITVASDGAVTVNAATKAKQISGAAGSVNADRHVWFSDSVTETVRNYDDDFKYNPNTNTLKVAKIDGVELTGTPKAPTAASGTNSTQIATTAFVQNAVGNAEIGGRNLVKDSHKAVSNSSYATADYYFGDDPPLNGEEVTIQIKGQLADTKSYWYLYNSGGSINCFAVEKERYDATTGIYTDTGTWRVGTSSNTFMRIYAFTLSQSGTSTIEWVKLERGNKPTDWTPAPEDLVSSISLSGSTLSYKNPIGTQLGSYTLSKSTVGLGNVDNTSDANKPISTATQTALDQITNSIGNAKLFTGICSTVAGTAEKDVTCASFKATDLVKGTRISVYFENTNSANIANLKLDVNDTGAKPIKHIYNGSYANIPGTGYLKAGQIYTFTYDGTNWVVEMMYNSNTYPDYLSYRNNTYAKKAIAAQRLIVGDKDGYEEAVSGVTFDLSYPILYTTGAVAQGNSNYANMMTQYYDINLGNIKSGFTSSAKKMIYLIVTISGNTATVDSNIITDTLPSTDDGKAYITLGRLGAQSTGANYFLFQAVHPIFVYRKGALRLYSGSADIVNGHTVEADVPSNAVFTDKYVAQKISTTDNNYPLLLSDQNNTVTTDETIGRALRNNSVYVNPKTGLLTATALKSNNYLQIKNQGINVASTYSGANVDEIILYTGIKFVSSNLMPKVHITGFAYGGSCPIDLSIAFYIYSDKLCNQGVVDNGGWHPDVYLFKYTKNSTEYVAIALRASSHVYYPTVSADVINEFLGKLTNIDLSLFEFQFTAKDAASVIPTPDNGVTCIQVPYKTNYNPKPTLTVQLNSTTLNTYDGTEAKTINVTKAGLGLGNVENKSSATIRGELTASNVTTALGYTPLNKAGDSMSGTLALLGNQYGDSYSSYALNLNNSNIVGVNSIYTADLSDNSQEGIHFYRSSTAVDTLYAKNGVLYFVPNRTLGQNGTSYTILNENNYTSYTQKVNDGNTSYLFNKGAYVGGSGAKKYLRITLPDNQAHIWNMIHMEVSLRKHYPSESGGKILIEAMHNATSPYTWTGFNASVLGYLPSTLTVHASDAKYFYILNNTTYASASLDRILVGDTVRSYDISAVTLDWVDELPETHQDATMYYGIHTGNISAHLNDIYVNRSGDTMTGNLTISHATNATMTAESTNPQITFSENGTQPVHLIYTDYDTYRYPAGLKVVGGSSATPAWFEVEGDIYEAGTKISDKYVNVSGDTMTGTLIVPIVQTGTANNNYFQSRKFRGEGGADTYTHAIDFGYAGHNQVDFYEYGGLYQFWKNTSSSNTTNAVLLGKITTNGWEGNVVGHASEDLPLAGSTISNPNTSSFALSNAMTGNIFFTNTGNTSGGWRGIGGIIGGNDGWVVRGYQTANNQGNLEIAVGDDGNEGIYVRQYHSGAYKIPLTNKPGSDSGLNYREIELMAPSTGASKFPVSIETPLLKVRELTSIEGGIKTVLCKNYLVSTNTTLVDDTTKKLTTSSPEDDWLKALLKQICIEYPGYTDTIFRGWITPNSIAYYEVFIYNTSATDSTTGLPAHSYGTWRHYINTFTVFGTAAYVFYNYIQLDSYNYSTYVVPKTGGIFSGAVTINGNLTIGSGKDIILPNNYGIRGTLSDGSTSNTWMLYMGNDNKVHLSYGSREVVSAGKITSTNGFVGDLTGNATAAYELHQISGYNYSNRPTSANIDSNNNGGIRKFLATGSMTTGKPNHDAHIIQLDWDNSNTYATQIASLNTGEAGRLATRAQAADKTWTAWSYVYDTAHKPTIGDIGAAPASGSTSYVNYGGNDTGLGSGTTAAKAKEYFADATKVPAGMVKFFYNNSGAEFTTIFSKAPNSSYGSVLKWGYGDRYLRILRNQASTWKSDDWEKIDAGYADSAGYTTNLRYSIVDVNNGGNIDDLLTGSDLTFTRVSHSNIGWGDNDGLILNIPWSTAYGRQIALDDNSSWMATRAKNNTSGWTEWDRILTKSYGDTLYLSKTGTHTHIVTDLSFGTKGLSGSLDPITAYNIGPSASNKTFGLPAEAITVEYSTDAGATWQDYGLSDYGKKALFAETREQWIYAGKNSTSGQGSTNYWLRVTIYPSDGRYAYVNGLYLWVSRAGVTATVDLQRSTRGNPDTFTEVFSGQDIAGWNGNNIRYFSSNSFGGGTSQTSNGYKYRMIFKITSIADANYGTLSVSDIRFLGSSVFSFPSGNYMMKHNRLYNWDADLNATFPAKLIAPIIQTGTDSTSYFQSQKFRGQGDANTYYHAIDFGYGGHNQVDFYEYGGIYNFWKNTGSGTSSAILLGKITTNGWEGNVVGNVTGHASSDLPLAGGTMTGPLKWKDSNALPQATSASYLLTIDAFASGGTTKWISASSVTVGSATTATTATNLTNFKVTITASLGLETTTNAIGYISGLTRADWNYQQVDGALYTQFYSANWKHQIFGDYRTGHISVRGKNNGTWQDWKRVLDEGNYEDILNSVYLGINDNAVSASALVSASSVTSSSIDDFISVNQLTWAHASSISGIGLSGNDGMVIAMPYSVNSTSYGRQFLIDDDSTKIFTRYRSSNSWKDWDQVLTRSVFDTLGYLPMYSTAIIIGEDLDSFMTKNGFQWAKLTNATGLGLSNNDGMVFYVPFGNSFNSGRQFILDDDSNKMFTRYKASGSSWTSSWDQILTKSVADDIYASGDFVSKSGDTMTGELSVSKSSSTQRSLLDNQGLGLWNTSTSNSYPQALVYLGSDNTLNVVGETIRIGGYSSGSLTSAPITMGGDLTATGHITGSFGYAMLTIQNKAISTTSHSAITGFTSSHYNDTLFSHSGNTITVKKHGVYRMVIRWHLSSTASAASVKNIAWAKSGTTTEFGWGAVGRANTYETITSEFLQEISANTTLTLIGRSEGGSSTFRAINAWVELVELL